MSLHPRKCEGRLFSSNLHVGKKDRTVFGRTEVQLLRYPFRIQSINKLMMFTSQMLSAVCVIVHHRNRSGSVQKIQWSCLYKSNMFNSKPERITDDTVLSEARQDEASAKQGERGKGGIEVIRKAEFRSLERMTAVLDVSSKERFKIIFVYIYIYDINADIVW